MRKQSLLLYLIRKDVWRPPEDMHQITLSRLSTPSCSWGSAARVTRCKCKMEYAHKVLDVRLHSLDQWSAVTECMVWCVVGLLKISWSIYRSWVRFPAMRLWCLRPWARCFVTNCFSPPRSKWVPVRVEMALCVWLATVRLNGSTGCILPRELRWFQEC